MLALQIQEDFLTFELTAPVQEGAQLLVTVTTHAQEEQKIQITALSCRQLHEESYLVTARAPISLQDLVPSDEVPGARNGNRQLQRLRVVSRELSEYSALTYDISRSGLRLETTTDLQPGELLALEIGFAGLEADVACEVQVVRCAPQGERFVAGCMFCNPGEFRLRQGLATLFTEALSSPVGLERRPRMPRLAAGNDDLDYAQNA